MPNAYHGWRRSLARRGVAVAIASAAVLGGVSLTDAQPKSTLEVYSATIAGVETPEEPRRGDIRVIIERWSTEEERQALVQAYDQKGPAGLLSALRETKRLGTLRTSKNFDWDLHYAVQVPTADGGRRIIVATDRRVDAWEVDREGKTDYPFTLIELSVDKDGNGEGRASAASKIGRSEDGARIELEHYSADPLRLLNVRKQKN